MKDVVAGVTFVREDGRFYMRVKFPVREAGGIRTAVRLDDGMIMSIPQHESVCIRFVQAVPCEP